MKKLFTIFSIPVLTLLTFLILFTNTSRAETKQETRCYSECAAYKFIWTGDICFDMVQHHCSIGSTDMVKKAIFFIKDAYNLILRNKLAMIIGVSDVFRAWFICKPLITDCIVPQLNWCKAECDYDSYAYSPNISVGSPYSNYLRGIRYDDSKNKLYFKAINNGKGYAWDIKAEASWGSTPNRDGKVSGGGQLFSETIPELLFLGSRQGIPPSLGETVTDFLIDESNFSNYLSKFKSDADKRYIPPAWQKTIDFEAPEGELTKVIFNVDPEKYIFESNESDNTFVLEIDKRPAPAKFEFESITVERVQDSLSEFNVVVKVKNVGEEEGEANLKWFEGNKTTGVSSFLELSKVIGGGGSHTFTQTVTIDNSDGLPGCQRNKRFSILLTDPYGGKRETYFEIPVYAGQISGKVENIYGENVSNATVKLSNGQETETNSTGHFYFKGITQLGKFTVTVTHPDYTQPQNVEIEMKFDQGQTLESYCQNPGLSHNLLIQLQDEPVLLTIIIKDKADNELSGKVNISCGRFNMDLNVPGTGNYPDIQPGKCQFNVMSNGYISQSQTIYLTAPDQTVEFVLTKLIGRDSDTGLNIHAPQLLWEKELPNNEFISEITLTKNGKLLVFYSSHSGNKYGKLYFIEPITGNEIKVADVPYTIVSQGFVNLDSSYDGRTVGVNIKTSPSTKVDNTVKLFNASGQEYNSTTIDGMLVPTMTVSPDGTYIDGVILMNNSLHKYTKYEIYGEGHGDEHYQTPSNEVASFTKDNNVITKYGDSVKILNFKRETVRDIGDIDTITRQIDASQSENEIIVRTDKRLYYFSQGNNWEKELTRNNRFVSSEISNGGDYIITTEGSAGGTWHKLKIFNRAGQDITPEFDYSDVRFVSANDTGIYFMTVRGEKLGFYKIGSYDTEYDPDEDTGYEEGENAASGLQIYNYNSKSFEDTYPTPWFNIASSQMYKTTRRTTFKTDFGTITFSRDTIFSKFEDKPIIISGQAQIHATRPIEMVLIKNKIYDPDAFYDKLFEYYNGNLPNTEYVIAKNLHTKYIASTEKGVIKLVVISGEVLVSFDDNENTLQKGQKINIDNENNVKIGKDLSSLFIYLILAIVVGSITYIQIKYRKSEKLKNFNRKLLDLTKKILRLLLKLLKKVFALLKRFILFIFDKLKDKIRDFKSKNSSSQNGSRS